MTRLLVGIAAFSVFFCQEYVLAAQAVDNTPMPWVNALDTPGVDVPFAFNVSCRVPDAVANLTTQDMAAIAAYAASLPP